MSGDLAIFAVVANEIAFSEPGGGFVTVIEALFCYQERSGEVAENGDCVAVAMEVGAAAGELLGDEVFDGVGEGGEGELEFRGAVTAIRKRGGRGQDREGGGAGALGEGVHGVS